MRIAYLVAVLVIAGCSKTNDNFCEGFPENNCDNGCDSNDDCANMEGLPLCKPAEPIGVCVECLDNSVCGVDEPQCGSDNRCFGCSTDDECPSKACLENRVCADRNLVIYARPGADGSGDCGDEAGTNECSLAQALTKVAQPRNIIRLAPGNYATSDGLTIRMLTTLIARGSTITRMSSGSVITVEDSQAFKLIGGTLQNSNNNQGIECKTNGSLRVHEATIENMSTDREGIDADTCELTVSRSTIRRNLGGGITMNGTEKTVNITNNFIVGNGNGNNTDTGGMLLRVTSDSVVEFNTVADNSSRFNNGLAGGINCTGSIEAANNLVYRNSGGPGASAEVSGTCNFSRSFTEHPPAPDRNDVGFKTQTGPDYHLTPGSPGTVLNVSTCTGVDFDGDRRPLGDKCDLGADEVVP